VVKRVEDMDEGGDGGMMDDGFCWGLLGRTARTSEGGLRDGGVAERTFGRPRMEQKVPHPLQHKFSLVE